MKHRVFSILREVDCVPLSAAVTEATGSWGAHGCCQMQKHPSAMGHMSTLLLQYQQLSSAMFQVLKDHAWGDAARTHLPGATLALLKWGPLQHKVISWKARKRKGPEEQLPSLLVDKEMKQYVSIYWKEENGKNVKSLNT